MIIYTHTHPAPSGNEANKPWLFCRCPLGNVHNPPRTGAAAGVDAHRPDHVCRHVQLVLHADDGHPLCEYWSQTANRNHWPFGRRRIILFFLTSRVWKQSLNQCMNQHVCNILLSFLQDTTTIEKMAHFSNEMWVSLNHCRCRHVTCTVLQAMPIKQAERMHTHRSLSQNDQIKQQRYV